MDECSVTKGHLGPNASLSRGAGLCDVTVRETVVLPPPLALSGQTSQKAFWVEIGSRLCVQEKSLISRLPVAGLDFFN